MLRFIYNIMKNLVFEPTYVQISFLQNRTSHFFDTIFISKSTQPCFHLLMQIFRATGGVYPAPNDFGISSILNNCLFAHSTLACFVIYPQTSASNTAHKNSFAPRLISHAKKQLAHTEWFALFSSSSSSSRDRKQQMTRVLFLKCAQPAGREFLPFVLWPAPK